MPIVVVVDSIYTIISIKLKIHVIIVLTNNDPFLQNDRTSMLI
jgi:hypothetical protein